MTITFRWTVNRSIVLCGHLGIRRKDPDYLTLLVMDHVLGSGPGLHLANHEATA